MPDAETPQPAVKGTIKVGSSDSTVEVEHDLYVINLDTFLLRGEFKRIAQFPATTP